MIATAITDTTMPGLQARHLPSATDSAGYMISTLELSAGLDVQPLSLSTLPDETLRELLRLRGSWAPQAGRLPRSPEVLKP